MLDLSQTPLFRLQLTRPQRRAEVALADHDIVAIIAGNRASKTTGGIAICGRALVGGYHWARPPVDCCTVSMSQGQASSAFQRRIEELLWTLPQGVTESKTTRDQLTSTMKFVNQSRYVVKTTEMGWEVLQGAEYDLEHFDEHPDRKGWKELAIRVKAGRRLRRLLTLTPTQGKTWLFTEVLDPAQDVGLKIALIEAAIFENGPEPCVVCGRDRHAWDVALRAQPIPRNARHHLQLKAHCPACHTFGTTCRILPAELQRLEQEFAGDARELAVRFYGEIAALDGTNVFTPEERHAILHGCRPADTTVGGWKRWQDPQIGHAYVLGVDAASGVHRDNTAATLLEAYAGEQVAAWADNVTPVEGYEQDVYEWAETYHHAKLWIEAAQAGLALLEILKRTPANLYRHRALDRRGFAIGERVGWISSLRGRDSLLRNLIHAIRKGLALHPDGTYTVQPGPGAVVIRDLATAREVVELYYNAEHGNRLEVPSGVKDDRIFALAGAHECRMGRGFAPPEKAPLRAPDADAFPMIQDWLRELAEPEVPDRRAPPVSVHPLFREE